MTNNKLVGTIKNKGQEVDVVCVEGLSEYSFEAVGEVSLPLAVELAVVQTQKGRGFIDRLMSPVSVNL